MNVVLVTRTPNFQIYKVKFQGYPGRWSKIKNAKKMKKEKFHVIFDWVFPIIAWKFG